jgi:hypothetical protein
MTVTKITPVDKLAAIRIASLLIREDWDFTYFRDYDIRMVKGVITEGRENEHPAHPA